MAETRWNGWLPRLIEGLDTQRSSIDRRHLRFGVNAYCVRSHDGNALRFCLPLLIDYELPGDERDLMNGADGAVGVIIEHIKSRVRKHESLRPIGGLDTRVPSQCAANLEPVTVIRSPRMIGEGLWKPDRHNYLDHRGLHIEVRGALPYPGAPAARSARQVQEAFANLLPAIGEECAGAHETEVIHACLLSIDQKMLREELQERGLVAFIGDGTRPARTYTRYRGHFRIAGPKAGVNIPFVCPVELDPIEVECHGSGGMLTGLGIRKGELLAIAGSNAQGKSTLVQAIIAGEDDHAGGDGRELLVTVKGARTAQVGGDFLSGADISMFFQKLPPGVRGTPTCVYGKGSGSMVMAHQIQTARTRRCPLLMVDEDTAATNLLVPSCVQTEDVVPLSSLLEDNRDVLNGMTLLFAVSAMDHLTAQADRILLLHDHEARGIRRDDFRRALQRHLVAVANALKKEEMGGDSTLFEVDPAIPLTGDVEDRLTVHERRTGELDE